MEDLLTRPAPAPSGTSSPAVREFRTTGTGRAAALTDASPAPGLARPEGRRRLERLVAWRHFDAFLLLTLTALALVLHGRTLWTSYWGDEAIAVGIASHPLSSLPHYLVDDGSPPLYYVMLHYWMRMFGPSEVATHVLSLVPGLLAIPAAWWSADRLFGRWAARAAAALVATCAYLAYYGTETRMYSWLVLVSLLAVTCFVLAYRGAGRRYWTATTLLMAAVLYLQYYGLYLAAATVIVGSAVAARRRAWSQLRATGLYGAACAALFAPWAPQFLYQLTNTGAPWAPHPSVLDFFGDSFNALASAAWAAVVVALVIAVLSCRWPQPAGTLEGPTPHVPALGPGVSALALFTAIPLVTLLLAWLAGQVVNSWDPRYLGIAVVPALVPLAGGLARARGRSWVAGLTVLALAATSIPVLVDRTVTVGTSKSDVAYLASELAPLLQPGALVISPEVTDTPVIAADLGDKYHYATPFGLVTDPMVVNWSDLAARLQHTNAASNLGLLLGALPVGAQVLVVNPTSWGGGETPRTYAGPVEEEAIAATNAVLDDPQLQSEKTLGVPRYSNSLYPMNATLFIKILPSHGSSPSGEGGI
ncbi:MAG: glycosyltransferase family 39 protein [Acidimicrobiales bacterium]